MSFRDRIRKGPLGKAWNHTFGKKGLGGGPDEWFDGGAWDYTFGKHGLGKAIDNALGGPEERALKAQAGNVVSTGLEDLEAEGAQYLGPEGFLQEGFERQIAGMDIDYATQLSNAQTQLTSQGAKAASFENAIQTRLERSGFDKGPITPTERMNQQVLSLGIGQGYENMTMAGEKYMLGLDEAAANFEKSKLDYMSNLRKQRTQLLSEYMAATGEAYGGDVSAFDTWLEGYEESV